MALSNLIIKLRQRLLDALEQNDKQELHALMMTFGSLKEAAYEEQGKPFAIIMEELEYSAQHGLMGVKPKALAAVPSPEAIMTACA
jgi:hypothetical protein